MLLKYFAARDAKNKERAFTSAVRDVVYDARGNPNLSRIFERIKLELLEGGLTGTAVLPLIDGQTETVDVQLSLKPDVNVTFGGRVASKSDVRTRFNVTIRACYSGEGDKVWPPCSDSAKQTFIQYVCIARTVLSTHHAMRSNRPTPSLQWRSSFRNPDIGEVGPSPRIPEMPMRTSLQRLCRPADCQYSCIAKHRGSLCATCKNDFVLDRSNNKCHKY